MIYRNAQENQLLVCQPEFNQEVKTSIATWATKLLTSDGGSCCEFPATSPLRRFFTDTFLMLKPTLWPGRAVWSPWWCISMDLTSAVNFAGEKVRTIPGFKTPVSILPTGTVPTPGGAIIDVESTSQKGFKLRPCPLGSFTYHQSCRHLVGEGAVACLHYGLGEVGNLAPPTRFDHLNGLLSSWASTLWTTASETEHKQLRSAALYQGSAVLILEICRSPKFSSIPDQTPEPANKEFQEHVLKLQTGVLEQGWS